MVANQPTGSSGGPSAKLSREQILAALEALNLRLRQRGSTGELCRFGGAVMVLAYQARLATKDVDALFQPACLVRELAVAVAREAGLPADRLNDGVKGFVSARHEDLMATSPHGRCSRRSRDQIARRRHFGLQVRIEALHATGCSRSPEPRGVAQTPRAGLKHPLACAWVRARAASAQ
jgi:hypothetical protein